MANPELHLELLLSKTVRGITGAEVVSMSAEVQDGRISNFKTTVKIAFAIEGTE